MTNLSDKVVCVVDNGLFTGFARKLAPAFKKVLYYMPWQSAFPKSRQLVVGEGFPEIERVPSNIRYRKAGGETSGRHWTRLKDAVDLWAFLDVFHADLQWELSNEGRRVWGARDAEELELYRWEARAVFKRLGLPVLPAELVVGMKALREHLKTAQPPKFIKQSFTRGDWETWEFKGYPQAERRLEQMEYDLGPIKDDYEFIVEDALDFPEFGYDGAVIDNQFLYPAMLAPEVKGLGMVGRIIQSAAELPPGLASVNGRLAPEFARLSYRGFFSSEVRRDVLLDPCCRLGSPSNELLQELIGNWPEIMWEGAGGRLVPARVLHRYGAVAMAYAEDSGQNWQELFYPPALDPWVKLRNPLRVGARKFAVPQGAPQNLAGIVGVGSSLLEAIGNLAEHAAQVKGDHIDIALPSMWDALDILQAAEGKGIRFGPLPSPAELRQALQA